MNDNLSFDSDAQPASINAAKDILDVDLIEDLLKQQDSVLERLDELNLRIENAILEIGKARQVSRESSNQAATKAASQTNTKVALRLVPKAA